MARRCCGQPAVVFLAYPNNPTGNLFDRKVLTQVIAQTPGLVVIDEAYFPFAGQTWLHEYVHYDNVVVMQTLSKTGLAGLRVGMLAGSRVWLDEFNKVRLPYNINILSQISAEFILTEHAGFLHEQAEQIRRDRQSLLDALRVMSGIDVWPSDANFLLFRVRGDATHIHAGLRARGVLVKSLDGAHPLLRGCLRVTVGTSGENELFLEALESALRHD